MLTATKIVTSTIGLLCLSTTVSADASLYEIEEGKAAGFTHGLSDMPGDFMTATFCYCGSPVKNMSTVNEGHYFLFEYYNKALNTTFILSDVCRVEYSAQTTCFPPRREHNDLAYPYDLNGRLAPYNFGREGLCRTWPRLREFHGHQDHDYYDKLCYKPHASKKSGTDDYIEFNGQKRNISKGGGQNQVDEEVTDAPCEDMCMRRTGLPMLRGNPAVKSHVARNKDMDNMCDDGCK